METGLRFNNGKLRYDLIHPQAQEGLVRVLTKGAEKYAPKNWEKGMDWSIVLASMKRHIAAFEKGEDYDPETGELHVDHIQCNAHFLSAYYQIHPKGDNRTLPYTRKVKIGLDIDEVLCNWVGPWCERHGYDIPSSWHFSYSNKNHFEDLQASGEITEFYMDLPAKIDPSDIPFEPHCYITARSVNQEITKAWLLKNGLPAAPVHSIGFGQSKVQVALESGIDIFVDDSYDNFVDLRNAGIACFLYDAPHNRRYNVGYYRVTSLQELAQKVGLI